MSKRNRGTTETAETTTAPQVNVEDAQQPQVSETAEAGAGDEPVIADLGTTQPEDVAAGDDQSNADDQSNDKAPEAGVVEAKYYVAVFGGPMIDPTSHAVITGVPTLAPLTGWLQSQIDAGKVAEAEENKAAE